MKQPESEKVTEEKLSRYLSYTTEYHQQTALLNCRLGLPAAETCMFWSSLDAEHH